MRSYDDLTEHGKIRRLHRLARAALAQYDIDVVRLRCIARDTNTTFRVDCAGGATYSLRVGTRPEDTEVDTATELAWLDALRGDPRIGAPEPQRTRSGELVTVITDPGVTAPRKCVLFSWLPGRPIGDAATARDYEKLGELAARLHDHGERWQRPATARPLVWDRVFYYPTEPVVLYDAVHAPVMTPKRRAFVREVEARAAAELDRLSRTALRSVLHGDLHPWNVHRHRNNLLVFDFEDVMVGAPVQDIAITLFYNRDRTDYPALRDAFEKGYRTLRPWPVEYDGQLELLMAARTVMFINYVLRLGLDAEEYVPMAVGRISAVLG